MIASVAMKLMDKDLIESGTQVVPVPFKGMDYIAFKRSKEDAIASAIRRDMRSGLAAGQEPVDWYVLTCMWTREQAFGLFDEGKLVLDKACVAPGWRMTAPIDLCATDHEWHKQTVPGALVMEDFVRVHLSDCVPSETTDLCKQCGRSDSIVYSRRRSWYYCPHCWHSYWSNRQPA